MLWVWLSDARNTWFRCHHPTPETTFWDHCQHYVHRCTLCLKVDRAYDPYHSYPCCGVYGRRREANGAAMTLTQVACQVTRGRPGYAFVTGKTFFSFLDHDPLRRMCGGLHRWVSQTLFVPRSSTWVVTNPLSGDAIGGPLVLHHLRTCSLSYASRGRVSIHLSLLRSQVMHAQITFTYHGWKTPFYYWKFHRPWETCAQEDDGSVLIYQGPCHFHYYPFIRHPSLGNAYRVVPPSR